MSTCTRCRAELPEVPAPLPHRWDVVPWPPKRRRRALMRRVVDELEHHALGRCPRPDVAGLRPSRREAPR